MGYTLYILAKWQPPAALAHPFGTYLVELPNFEQPAMKFIYVIGTNFR